MVDKICEQYDAMLIAISDVGNKLIYSLEDECTATCNQAHAAYDNTIASIDSCNLPEKDKALQVRNAAIDAALEKLDSAKWELHMRFEPAIKAIQVQRDAELTAMRKSRELRDAEPEAI